MAGRPKDSESWCKNIDGCTLAKKHAGQCKPASSANERSARSNCGGPHEYPAALERIRKLNNDPANDKADPSGLRAAGAALAADEKKAGKGKKGQTKLPINDRGTRHVAADHELSRKMTVAEWEEQSAKLAHDRVELMTLEDEIRRFKEERKGRMAALKESTAKGAREVDARSWLAVTPCIEVHDPSTRSVTVHAIGKGGEPGEVVIPARVMTQEEFDKACETMPFAPAMDPPDAPAVEGEPRPAWGDVPSGDRD